MLRSRDVQRLSGTADARCSKKTGDHGQGGSKSQNNIADDLPKTDILLIGPHLSYAFDELKAMCGPYAVPVLMIPKDMYAGLDGKGLLALCMETLKEKG